MACGLIMCRMTLCSCCFIRAQEGTNIPADVSLDQINQLFSDMRQVIAPYKHNDEYINNIDEYLFDLTAEINAMKVVDIGDQDMVQKTSAESKKNVDANKSKTKTEDKGIRK